MKLRKLEVKDIPYMLEWMHDEEITKYLKFAFNKATKESQEVFIKNSYTTENIHLAIVDDNDEYLGTISLKNINYLDLNGEYAICLRKKALGTDIAKKATYEILKIAFNDLKLKRVYLNVVSKNVRAWKFYEKMGFIYEGESKEAIMINKELENLKWYRVLKEEFAKWEVEDD